jgi:GMP synthase (glutamine-hydrolysing)
VAETATVRGRDCGDAREAKLPVLIILHQRHSSAGHIGHTLERLGYTLDIRRPRYGDPLPSTMSGHAGAVIFGGPMSANDRDEFIKAETDFVGLALKEARPFLGVCLGAQMLARQLGASVDFHPSAIVEIGYHAIRPTQAAEPYGRWPTRVYQWHREGFDLPDGATLLASSDGAFENQAFAYGPAAIGIQFHPEITHRMVLRWSGMNSMRLLLRGAQDRADQIAEHMLQGPAVRQWLETFLGRWLTRLA